MWPQTGQLYLAYHDMYILYLYTSPVLSVFILCRQEISKSDVQI